MSHRAPCFSPVANHALADGAATPTKLGGIERGEQVMRWRWRRQAPVARDVVITQSMICESRARELSANTSERTIPRKRDAFAAFCVAAVDPPVPCFGRRASLRRDRMVATGASRRRAARRGPATPIEPGRHLGAPQARPSNDEGPGATARGSKGGCRPFLRRIAVGSRPRQIRPVPSCAAVISRAKRKRKRYGARDAADVFEAGCARSSSGSTRLYWMNRYG